MAVPTGPSERHADEPSPPEDVTDDSTGVTVHSTDPDRALFIERDNPDGWIATDLTVDLRL